MADRSLPASLPAETLARVFSFLDARSLCRVERVCMAWADAARLFRVVRGLAGRAVAALHPYKFDLFAGVP